MMPRYVYEPIDDSYDFSTLNHNFTYSATNDLSSISNGYYKINTCFVITIERVEDTKHSAFEFRDNSIVVAIHFNENRKVGNDPVTRKHGLNSTRERIISEMRHNPNITKAELVVLLGISNTAIDNNVKYLRENGYIIRVGEIKTVIRKY